MLKGSPSLSVLAADPWRSEEKASKWQRLTKNLSRTQNNDEVLEKCKIVILSVKPQLFKSVAQEMKNEPQERECGQIIVSVRVTSIMPASCKLYNVKYLFIIMGALLC